MSAGFLLKIDVVPPPMVFFWQIHLSAFFGNDKALLALCLW